MQLIVFSIQQRQYALPLSDVERVVRAVDVTPLPTAPQIVLGVIDIGGRVIPVVNTRRRFHHPEQPVEPEDQFLIAHSSRRTVALVTDTVTGVIEHPAAEVVGAETVLPGLEDITGIVKLPDGLVLIHNLDRFLSLEEEQALDSALTG